MSMMLSASGRTAPAPQGQIQSSVRFDSDGMDERTRTVKGMRSSHIQNIFTHSSDDDNHAVANEPLWALTGPEGLDPAQWPLVWSSFNNFPIPKSAYAEVAVPPVVPGTIMDNAAGNKKWAELMAAYRYLLKYTRFIGFNQTDMNFTRRVGLHDKTANGTAIHHGIVQTVNTSNKEIRAGNYVRIRPPGKPFMDGRNEWIPEKSVNTTKNGILPTKALSILEAYDPDDVASLKQDIRDYMGKDDNYVVTIDDVLLYRDHLPPAIGVAETTAVKGGDFVELRVFFKSR